MTRAALDLLEFQRALVDLGAPAMGREWQSQEQAEAALQAIKAEAKRRYRALALELHPDRTGGDADKARRFAVIAEAWREIQRLKVFRRPPVQPVYVRVEWSGADIVTTCGTWTNINITC